MFSNSTVFRFFRPVDGMVVGMQKTPNVSLEKGLFEWLQGHFVGTTIRWKTSSYKGPVSRILSSPL